MVFTKSLYEGSFMTFHLENPKALYGLLALIPAIILAVFQYIKFKIAITSAAT